MRLHSLLLAAAVALAACGCKCTGDDPPPANLTDGTVMPVSDPAKFLRGDWRAIGVEGVPAARKASWDLLVRTTTMTIDGVDMVVSSTAASGHSTRHGYRITNNDGGHIRLATTFEGKPGSAMVEVADKDTIRVRHDKEDGFTVYKRK